MTEAASLASLRLDDAACGSPAGMAAGLVRLFEHVDPLPDKVQWVQRRIAEELGAGLDETLDRACVAIASTIDADAAAFDRQPYHNRQHFCEVALTAFVLCLLQRRTARDTQFVLLAALIHDFVHDGRAHAAFTQERASMDKARAIVAAAGMDATQLRRLSALVLATDATRGSAFMAAACRAHHCAENVPPLAPEAAPELAELVRDAGLSELARTLCEADVLPSVGLTLQHALHLQARLALEWRRPLGVQDKLAFVDALLAQGFIGEFFLANVYATRAALARAANELA